MPERNENIGLRHMLDHAREATALVQGKTRSDLDSDRVLNLALIRLLEIVGEAANRVSKEVRALHPEIPWPQIIGLRNRLIHGYDAVDNDILWQILVHDLPRTCDDIGSGLGRGHVGNEVKPSVYKALLWKRVGNVIRCLTCERRCEIAPGGLGWCRTRRHQDGKLVTLIYGAVSSLSVNPIEKKPLYHFYPGTLALTSGSWSCNFNCPWYRARSSFLKIEQIDLSLLYHSLRQLADSLCLDGNDKAPISVRTGGFLPIDGTGPS